MPKFNGKNVPVKEVARLMGKDQQFIRQEFYISPRLLWEYTGIIYNEE